MGDDVVIYAVTAVLMGGVVAWAYLGRKRYGRRDDRDSGGYYRATSTDMDQDRRGRDDDGDDEGGDGGGDD